MEHHVFLAKNVDVAFPVGIVKEIVGDCVVAIEGSVVDPFYNNLHNMRHKNGILDNILDYHPDMELQNYP